MQQKSFTSICITINNPPFLDEYEEPYSEAMAEPPFDPLKEWGPCSYAVYQLERGDSGTYHVQAYAEFRTSVRFSTCKRYTFLSRAHLELRRGSALQASNYCKKPESRVAGPWEFGTISNSSQGKRSDLAQVQSMIDDGASNAEVATAYFAQFVRYHRGFGLYKRLKTLRRNWQMEIIVLYGRSGSGKSRWAHSRYPNAYCQPDGKWFDDYEGEETVIVDEMYGSRWSWNFFLQITDRYPMKVEVKGSHCEFSSKRIIFTSNSHPYDWYVNKQAEFSWPGHERNIAALPPHPFRRRITTLCHLNPLQQDNQDPVACADIDAHVAQSRLHQAIGLGDAVLQ